MTQRYHWLKLHKDFFKRHDVKIIEDMENGKDYILFYLKLLVESVDHNGELRFSDTIPYNEKMLSTITNTNIDIVRMSVKIFSELGMMEFLDDGTIYMTQVQKMIGTETESARKMRRFRQRKELESSHSDRDVTKSDIEKELDKDKELDKETTTSIYNINLQEHIDAPDGSMQDLTDDEMVLYENWCALKEKAKKRQLRPDEKMQELQSLCVLKADLKESFQYALEQAVKYMKPNGRYMRKCAETHVLSQESEKKSEVNNSRIDYLKSQIKMSKGGKCLKDLIREFPDLVEKHARWFAYEVCPEGGTAYFDKTEAEVKRESLGKDTDKKVSKLINQVVENSEVSA